MFQNARQARKKLAFLVVAAPKCAVAATRRCRQTFTFVVHPRARVRAPSLTSRHRRRPPLPLLLAARRHLRVCSGRRRLPSKDSKFSVVAFRVALIAPSSGRARTIFAPFCKREWRSLIPEAIFFACEIGEREFKSVTSKNSIAGGNAFG